MKSVRLCVCVCVCVCMCVCVCLPVVLDSSSLPHCCQSMTSDPGWTQLSAVLACMGQLSLSIDFFLCVSVSLLLSSSAAVTLKLFHFCFRQWWKVTKNNFEVPVRKCFHFMLIYTSISLQFQSKIANLFPARFIKQLTELDFIENTNDTLLKINPPVLFLLWLLIREHK